MKYISFYADFTLYVLKFHDGARVKFVSLIDNFNRKVINVIKEAKKQEYYEIKKLNKPEKTVRQLSHVLVKKISHHTMEDMEDKRFEALAKDFAITRTKLWQSNLIRDEGELILIAATTQESKKQKEQ